MDRLPPEILREILGQFDLDLYWDRVALSNFRCTCRILSTVIEPILFQTVPLWISLQSIENLTILSEHPQISKCVKCIHFSTLWLRDTDDWHDKQVKEKIYRESQGINEADIRIGKHLAAREGFFKARQYLTDDNMASDLLARAFRRLPSLKGIHIRHADRSIGVKEAIGTLGVPSGFELGHNAELTVDILMRARRDAKLDLQSLRLSYAVASVAGEDVIDWTREEYDPDDNRPENTILKVSSRQPSTKDFQSVIGDFENFPPLMTLKTFEVTCLESTAHPRTGLDHFWLGALDIIEVNCSTLVSLKIDGGFDPEFGDHFMNCLSEMPIHVLRRLSLSEIYVKKCEHYLKLFAHSTSLIEMYLNGAIISSPRGWTRVVEWLRATKIHKPVRMVLKDCLPLEAGGHQAIDIGPYIGRKTRTNPLDDINDDGRY